MPTATKKPNPSSNGSAVAKAPQPGDKPGYKHTKLGWIPEEWTVIKGGAITSKITKGTSPAWQGFKYGLTGVLFVTSENVRDGFLDITQPKYVEVAFAKKMRGSALQYDDILINIVGASIGRSCRYSEHAPGNINQAVALFRVSEDHDPGFVQAFLQLPKIIGRLLDSQSETARPNLSLADLRNFEFACPPLSEQRRIAAVLGAWDRAIATTLQLLAAQQQRKQGLIGTALGEVYHHRRKVSVGDIAKEISERNTDGDDPIVLSCSKHRGFVSSLEYFKKQVFSEDRSNYKVIRRGQFGFPANHIEEGSIDLLRTHDVGLVSPLYVVFDFDQAKVNSEFMYHLFKSDRYRHIFRTSTNASVDRRGSLRWNDFKNLWVPLPEREEQDRLARLLTGLDRQMEQTQNYLDLLTTQKRGLMQQLLTGQTRVKA